jgi:DNA gyrase subunit B
LYPVKQIGETTKEEQSLLLSDPSIFQTIEYSYDTLSARMNYLIWIGITITFTDKRELDKDGNFVSEIFHSDEGLKEYIRYLDGNRANYCARDFYGPWKGEIPVEVALIYNTSYTENIFLT